jgi:hypothetical protein
LGTAYSVDITDQNIAVEVKPESAFNSPLLSINGKFGSFQLFAVDEQLAEIEYALRTYLNGIRYTEAPDQQAILNDELAQSIKEEIA